MFHSIPETIRQRMQYLEEVDARDRTDGTPRMQRLRQVTPEGARFIALLAASAPGGEYIEVGTSAGYSTLWLALACRARQRRIHTFEVLPEKVRLARQTFAAAGVEDVVTLIEGDAREHLRQYENIAFCFLDAEKEIYGEIYDLVVPRMVAGGILVADNAINHRETLQPMLERALNDQRGDALIVPVGKGELVCRKVEV
jgi:caffeoyl-CoA O-methyltransferase